MSAEPGPISADSNTSWAIQPDRILPEMSSKLARKDQVGMIMMPSDSGPMLAASLGANSTRGCGKSVCRTGGSQSSMAVDQDHESWRSPRWCLCIVARLALLAMEYDARQLGKPSNDRAVAYAEQCSDVVRRAPHFDPQGTVIAIRRSIFRARAACFDSFHLRTVDTSRVDELARARCCRLSCAARRRPPQLASQIHLRGRSGQGAPLMSQPMWGDSSGSSAGSGGRLTGLVRGWPSRAASAMPACARARGGRQGPKRCAPTDSAALDVSLLRHWLREGRSLIASVRLPFRKEAEWPRGPPKFRSIRRHACSATAQALKSMDGAVAGPLVATSA